MDKKKYITNLKDQISECDLLKDTFGLSFGMGDHFRLVDMEKVLRKLDALKNKHVEDKD
tara:strand:+ start:121 stop:297 length:177 start_codon:yes stop_codon:yes gene_type:complete